MEKELTARAEERQAEETRKYKRMMAAVLVLFVLVFALCSGLQFMDNKRNAEDSCALVLDQFKELVLENAKNLDEMQETLREEYIIRAVMAADHIEHDTLRYTEPEDYDALLRLLQVDEVHIFDAEGTIIGGSVASYYGVTMDAGEQISFFKPMLEDRSLQLCQDVTPNTAEEKPMMYAMVWIPDSDRLVQVGVTPDRLLEWMQSSDINHLVGRLPVIQGMSIYVVDDASGKVIGSTASGMLEYDLQPGDRLQGVLKEGERYRRTATFQNELNYITYERMEDYDISVAYTVKDANETLPLSMAEFGLILALTFLLLRSIVREYVASMEEQGRKLMASNIAKTDFLRRMSHDIRTPLNGIRGITGIAEHYPEDMEKQAECRRKVMQASGFLLELVNSVLNMNKLESGEMEPENKPFDLLELLEETGSILEMQGREHAIRFEEVAWYLPHRRLIGSPLYLKQVLQNIGGNAVKYSDPGSVIKTDAREIACEDGRAVIRFVCADTGRGMSREFLSRAFEPFSQENSGARTNYAGTGLGLAITKQMVELMGGDIRLESEQGVGTTVYVTIPFTVDGDYQEPEDGGEAEQTALPGVHILLAEDNALNTEIAQFLLERAGAEVTAVSNGQEAVDAFDSAPPHTYDLILMDVMMPVMDGLEATRRIRALPRPDAAEIPIFAMTANAFQDDVRRSREAGMNEHLSKPLQEREMFAAIRRYVGK